MNLVKFRAEGFRCLEKIDWIHQKSLSVYTGQNDGGKTSTIDAMDIFLNPRTKPENNDFTYMSENSQCDQILFEGIFKLSQQEQEELAYSMDEIHIKKICKNDSTITYLYKTQVHPDERLRRDLNTLSIDELRQIADDFNITLSTRRSKNPIIQEIQNWLNGQNLEEGFLELPSNFIKKFPEIKIFRSAQTLDPQGEINQTLSASFSTRIRTERYSGRLTSIQNEVEKELRSDLRDFEDIVKRYCPDILGIDIEPTFDFSRGFRTSKLKIRKEEGSMDLEKEGEGRKRRMTLAVYEWREKILQDSPEDRIVAFDEPDTHLDYLSQRKILDIIKRISSNSKNSVIVCTHSLNLIDRIPITDITHFRRVNDRTNVETLTTDDSELIDIFLYEISDSMGLKNSIMLNERCFLIVEGQTEMCSLPIFFKKLNDYSLQSGGIRVINGEGCGGVRSLAKFLNNNRRNVLFLLDSDSQNNPHRLFTPQKLQAEGFDIDTQIFFVGTQEFEDSFSDEIYERAANSYWPKHDDSSWIKQEFTQIRTPDFCDKLLRLVRSSTRTHISKTEIGLGLARVINNNEIPQEIVNCLNKALELAS